MSTALQVLAPGPLTLVQDRGRPGHMAYGVSPSGAADREAHARATRLVGNHPDAAALEVTAGGLDVVARGDLLLALTGARCPGVPHDAVWVLRDGTRLTLPRPVSGLRTTLAVRGGIAVEPVLGSRSHDVLSGLGPPPVGAGDVLPVGDRTLGTPTTDVAPGPPGGPDADGPLVVRLLPGPRTDRLGPGGLGVLARSPWEVGADSNRVAVRLDGTPVEGRPGPALPSEGLVRGAVQLPSSGLPVLFLSDHPVTGGYPIVAYVAPDDIDRAAQARPGRPVWMRA